MANSAIEMILMRQLGSYLAVPTLIVNEARDLAFFNEAAEPILGRRFQETGTLKRREWTELFRPIAAYGVPIPTKNQPLDLALECAHPANASFQIASQRNGAIRAVIGLAFPLQTIDRQTLGAAGIFWDSNSDLVGCPPSDPDEVAVEMILMRRLADRLTLPIVAVDHSGLLLFRNRAADAYLASKLPSDGRIATDDWYPAFLPKSAENTPKMTGPHPLSSALTHRRLVTGPFVEHVDEHGNLRRLDGIGFPLIGQCHRFLGAVGMFWEPSS